MRRRLARVLATLALVGAAGCQDYNFNPVGHCYIQPGTKRVRLADVATADILFVVDDSGSMSLEQRSLGQSFQSFVNQLNTINVDRAARSLEPIDFHIAVTTTSMFLNFSPQPAPASLPSWRCTSTCGTTPGPICCNTDIGVPLQFEKRCPTGGGCGAGFSCRTDCPQRAGEPLCCNGSGAFELETYACTSADAAASRPCGQILRRYPANLGSPPSCEIGVSSLNALYPRGDFVAAGSNPKVLHFDKELYAAPFTNKQGYTQQQLIDFFARDAGGGTFVGNVIVGTCGSGEEQGFAAMQAAITKAIANQQPGVVPGEWLHAGAKLVVVFIGDEDDCSAVEDPVRGVQFWSCTGDPSLDATSTFTSFLTGLGRPLGAAFIVSAMQGTNRNAVTCEDFACDPGLCCAACGCSETVQYCGGQQPGARFLEMRDQIGLGTTPAGDIVAGSICNPNFGSILTRVADIVKPPDVLDLPSAPATSQVTVLRVVNKAGLTSKTCRGPAPAGLTSAQATAAGWDWWFVAARTGSRDSVPLSQFVFVNHATNQCEANPGETYSADYLGVVPPPTSTAPGGCDGTNPTAGAAECAAALGPGSWTCEALNPPPAPGITGTCVCGT